MPRSGLDVASSIPKVTNFLSDLFKRYNFLLVLFNVSIYGGFIFSRALHMKEHPDYKYRPRRKPKPLLKKEQKFGFSLSPIISSSMDQQQHLPRSLMPPISTSSALPLLGQDSDLKIPRSLFPPLPYLYPFRHPEESKLAELAFFYSNNSLYSPSFNWPIGNLAANLSSSPCNICPTGFQRRSPSPDAMKRPVCVLMKSEEFRNEPVPGHVIWKPLPVLPERLNLGTWWSDIASLAASSVTATLTREEKRPATPKDPANEERHWSGTVAFVNIHWGT